MIHVRYEDVIGKLRSVSLAGKPIRLVVSRLMPGEEEPSMATDINDVSRGTPFVATFVHVLYVTAS